MRYTKMVPAAVFATAALMAGCTECSDSLVVTYDISFPISFDDPGYSYTVEYMDPERGWVEESGIRASFWLWSGVFDPGDGVGFMVYSNCTDCILFDTRLTAEIVVEGEVLKRWVETDPLEMAYSRNNWGLNLEECVGIL